jgi:hypothetical protein
MAIYSYTGKQLKKKVTPNYKINNIKDFVKENFEKASKTFRQRSVIINNAWRTSNRSTKAGIVVVTWFVSSLVLSPIVGTVSDKQVETNRQKYMASPAYAALVAEQKKQDQERIRQDQERIRQEQERIRQEQEALTAQKSKTPEEEELERYNARQREKCFARAVENKKALREEGWGNEFSELAGLAFAGCQ